jgi:hypothetical protein
MKSYAFPCVLGSIIIFPCFSHGSHAFPMVPLTLTGSDRGPKFGARFNRSNAPAVPLQRCAVMDASIPGATARGAEIADAWRGNVWGWGDTYYNVVPHR